MGIIDSAINAAVTTSINSKNKNYQDRVNRQIWKREDNAVQRRVEDLKKAGLSPVLAAGSAAGSGGIVQSPRMDAPQITDPLASAQDLMQQQADIGRTNAQKDLLEKQTEGQQTLNNSAAFDFANKVQAGADPKSEFGKMWFDLVNNSVVKNAKQAIAGKLAEREVQRAKDIKQINEQAQKPFFEQTVK